MRPRERPGNEAEANEAADRLERNLGYPMSSPSMRAMARGISIRSARLAAWCCALTWALLPPVWAQTSNPFLPPQATAQYERSREYDLRNVLLRLKLDWTTKTFAGTVTHTLAPLRDRLGMVTFDAGAD